MITEILQKVARREPLTLLEQDLYNAWAKEQDNVGARITELEAKAQRIDGVVGSITPLGTPLTKVSQISNDLGDMIAGRFIAPSSTATSTEPTNAGFTGSFMSGDGETFSGTKYGAGGVKAGALQWGGSNEDGTLTAGAGAVTLDSGGITLIDPNSGGTDKYITFQSSNLPDTTLASIYGYGNSNPDGFFFIRGGGGLDFRQMYIELLANSVQGISPGGISSVRMRADSNTFPVAGIQVYSSYLTSGVYLNSEQVDVDTYIYGDTTTVVTVDAGLEAVGIGGAAESGYKLKVSGKVNLTSGNTYDINGSPHTHTYDQVGGREVLTAARTYYVRTDGNDSNTGLANTSAAAFLTLQKAITTAAALDLSIYNVTIQVGDGTYTGANSILSAWVGAGTVTIQGNSGTPANVVISTTSNNAFTVENATVTIKDLKVQTTTSGNSFEAKNNGAIKFTNVNFGACAGRQIRCADGGIVEVTGNYSISGGGTEHWLASGTGSIRCQNKTITLTGTPNYTTRFATASLLGAITVDGNTYTGSATGVRYSAVLNGVIYANSGTLPGDSAGSTGSGGQYV